MIIIVDHQKCTGLGICESIAPDIFETADDGSVILLRGNVSEPDRDRVEEAVRSCPTAALRLAAQG